MATVFVLSVVKYLSLGNLQTTEIFLTALEAESPGSGHPQVVWGRVCVSQTVTSVCPHCGRPEGEWLAPSDLFHQGIREGSVLQSPYQHPHGIIHHPWQ